MAMKTKIGSIKINDGKDVLIREVLRMLPYTTVTLLGPAGTGKTTVIEEIAEKAGYIDELAILRLQGLSSEDFRMPMVVEERVPMKFGNEGNGKISYTNYETPRTKKTVEFAKMGILKDICDNPDKKYLIFFDEILRCDASVAPLLFELFERKIDGVFRPNMFVMCATNLGDDYICNIDFTDPALRRRQIFIEWDPNKEDIIEYMLGHQYHPIIQEVVETLPYSDLINHDVANELEQTTQLGSWAMLNNRWKHIEEKEHLKLDYRTAKEDVAIFGAYMFNDTTALEIINKLTLFEQINTIDLHKEIIVNQGLSTPDYVMHDKRGNVYEYEKRKTELLIRTKYFVRNQILKDPKYLEDNAKNIVMLFDGKPEMFVSFFKDINKAIERECNLLFKDNQSKAETEATKRKSFIVKQVLKVQKENTKDAKIVRIFKNFSEGLSLMSQGAA